MPLRREERVGGDGGGAEHGAATSPPTGKGRAGGGLGVVGKGAYIGGCMGASSMGGGHQGGAHLLEGDDNGSKQIDKWVARYRDHAAFGYIFRENARDMLNSKTTCRRPGRSSTCRRSADGMAHAEGRPHGGWVWAVPGSSPHVQSHGKCVCMMWFTGWVVVRGRHEARVRGKHFGWDIDEFTRALNANGSGARGICDTSASSGIM